MASRSHEMDMCNGPLVKKMLIFALPIMAMNLLQLLFNSADMIVVGQFAGSDSLGAVGATGPLINLLVNLFMGLAVGTSVLVAQDYGSQDYAGVQKSLHTSVAVSLIGGVIVMVIGVLFASPMLSKMGTPDEILDLATLYMKIYFLGMPANMLYNFGAAAMRAIGDSRHPMYYLIVSGLVNVVLNVLFVVAFGMKVDGVAWATVISQYLSVVLLMAYLFRTDTCIRFELKKMTINGEKLKGLLRIGLPAGMQGVLFSISNVLIQSATNSFGKAMVAASSASGNVEGLVGTTMNAYYNAAITFTGQNVGAKKYERLDQIVKVCLVLIFATWLVLGGVVMLFGKELLGIYTTEAEVVRLGYIRLRIELCLYFTCGIMSVIPGVLRGMGYSIMPMLITLVGACVMRIIWLATIFYWFRSISTLFWAYPVTWGLAAIGHLCSYLWARKRIRAKTPMTAQ